jgi:protein SCO1/2
MNDKKEVIKMLKFLMMLFLSNLAFASSPNVSTATYDIPELMIFRDDGVKINIKDETMGYKPIAINFVFTTCAGICPALSRTFVAVQKQLGEDASKVHLISFSIDPENDTVSVLQEHMKKLKTQPGWNFYTGTFDQIIQIEKAFHAYFGDKMNHQPLTIIHRPGESTWTRIDGFATANQIVSELRKNDEVVTIK